MEMQMKQKGQAFLTCVEMGSSEHLLMRCGHVVPGGGGSRYIKPQHLAKRGHPYTDRLSPPPRL